MPWSPFSALLLAAVLLTQTACPTDQESFRFELMVATPTGSCDGTRLRARALPQGESDVRFTFIRRPQGLVGQQNIRSFDLVCDRFVATHTDEEFLVPLEGEDPLAVKVDVFADNGELIYSGMNPQVTLSPAQESATVLLFPTPAAPKDDATTSGMTCLGNARRGRAFHTATLLPNGEVLLVGGIAAAEDGGGAELDIQNQTAFVSGAVQVFSPLRGGVAELGNPPFKLATGEIPPRAFHNAVLLPSDPEGPYRVLLFGGIQPVGADPATPAILLRHHSTESPFLLGPAAATEAAPAGILTFTPSDPDDPLSNPSVAFQALGDFPTPLFPASAPHLGAAFWGLAGGGAGYAASGVEKGFATSAPAATMDLALIASGETVSVAHQVEATVFRAGHTISPLGQDRFLLLGGQMNGDGATDLVELFTTGGSANLRTQTLTPTNGASVPETTAWHTATPLGVDDQSFFGLFGAAQDQVAELLWAGGFSLGKETDTLRVTGDPVSEALHWIHQDGTTFSVQTLAASDPGHFVPAGYHDALRLGDGAVMLSGGNHNQTRENCSAGTVFCAHDQVVVYEMSPTGPQLRTFSESQPALHVARFGHRTVRLLDDTVLITGGITRQEGDGSETVSLVFATELFNPRTAKPEADFPIFRPGGQDSAGVPGEAANGGQRCATH